MTLEDFFTLTEMKDGLTAPSRVQELASVMQKEQDCVVKNAGDATRQWAAVASTIAATENKDCLDLFVQLNGLWFINKWLKDAQTFGADTNDGFIEESITAMLQAVEKLHLDSEKSISSGIQVTVSDLISHHSSRVQDRARILFDSWNASRNGDAESHDMEIGRVNDASDKIVREEGRPSVVDESGEDNDHASGLVGGEKSLSRSSDSLLPETVASVQIQSSDHANQSSLNLDCEDVKERSPNHLASVSTTVQEVAPINEGETTSAGTCNFPLPKQGSFEGGPEVLQLNDLSKKKKQEQNVNGPPEKFGAPEISLASTKPEPGPVSMGASEAITLESVKEPALEHNVENNKDGVCHKITASSSMRTSASDRKSGVDDIRAINTSNLQLFKAAENDNDCSNALQDSSVSGSNVGKPEVLEMSFSKTEYVRAAKEGKDRVSNEGDDTSNGSDSIKWGKGSRSPNIIDKKSSDLEYGIADALDLARKVAQEVEREICSSSEIISEGGIRRPGSSDSIRKKDELNRITQEEVSSRQRHSAEACSEEEGHLSISDDIEIEPECIPDMESSQVTEAAQDPGGNSEKSLCAFDLNEEVGSDDMDVSVNTVSTTMPIVSASKPAQTPGLPLAPLQFEGTLGRKGSTATSAFHPASACKNSDSEKNASVGVNSDISKQREDCLDIDLNVAEGEEVKQIAESSCLPSVQSSVECSPKRSSRLDLDLNSTGDDGDVQPSEQRMEGQLFSRRNGCWSPSPASSSSSMQPSVRNIDLNDRPYLQTDLVDQGSKSAHIINSYGRSKSDAPVISILGAKVEVGRRESVPQTLSLPNGKAIDPAMDQTMSRAGGILGMGPTVPFNHSTVFGYNGLTSTPPLSFSSAMYGSGGTIPYMVDSRGAPVVPQAGGPSSTVLSSYSQPSFIMSLAGTQLGLNGIGPSRPNFDLNSGFMIEGGNRDPLAARQFFFPAQGRPLEEHVRTFPQSSSSGVGGKRKEPDKRWETYPFSYKHPQSPWK